MEAAPRSAVRRFLLVMFTMAASACGTDRHRELRPAPGPATHPVEIHVPLRLTGVSTERRTPTGQPERVACVVCHSLRKPEALPSSMAELDEFHQGLELHHGVLTCGSCHVIGDQSSFRLADGRTIAMRDAKQLCAQCHGPQTRDYDHGSHGGMTGYWDRSVGPRLRNHCVDCHDPHAPQIPATKPVLRPRDRGLTQGGEN